MAEGLTYTVLSGSVSLVRLVDRDGNKSDLCVKGPFVITEEVAKTWLRG